MSIKQVYLFHFMFIGFLVFLNVDFLNGTTPAVKLKKKNNDGGRPACIIDVSNYHET